MLRRAVLFSVIVMSPSIKLPSEHSCIRWIEEQQQQQNVNHSTVDFFYPVLSLQMTNVNKWIAQLYFILGVWEVLYLRRLFVKKRPHIRTDSCHPSLWNTVKPPVTHWLKGICSTWWALGAFCNLVGRMGQTDRWVIPLRRLWLLEHLRC